MSAKTAPPRGQPISCNVSEPPDRVGHAARTASRVAKATAALQLLSRRAHAARQRVPIAHAIHPVAGTAMSMSVAAVGASYHLSVTVRRRAPQRRMARSSSSRPAAAHGTTPAPPIRATPPRMHGPRPRHPTTARADEPPVRQLAAARIPPRKRPVPVLTQVNHARSAATILAATTLAAAALTATTLAATALVAATAASHGHT